MKEIKVKDNAISISPSANYLLDYLVQLGIPAQVAPNFLTEEPPFSDMDDPFKLDNMQQGVDLMWDCIRENRKIYVQVDCDTDGFTSSAIFCQYFKTYFPHLQISWGVHSGKEHGIEMDKVGDAELVVIPDAGSMQLEEQRELGSRGVKVLILDHHEVSDMLNHPNVVLINNQASARFTNKALSGAGVTLLFVRAFDELYGPIKDLGCGLINVGRWQQYMDLAAVGIIADVMDTRTPGNNYIIRWGLSHIRNKILQEILKSRAYSINDIAHPTKIDIAFYVAPLINGLIRSGSQEEKENFFRAMADNNLTELVTSESRGSLRTETVYENVVRLATNAKGRQDNAKKRGSALLVGKIREHKLDEHQVIAVPVTKDEQETVLPTLTGLTAMELSKSYHKPVMVLREGCDDDGNVTYSGSLRADQYFETLENGQLKPVPSLMELINESGLGWAEGHPFAAGCGFTAENLRKFIEFADKRMKNVDFTAEYIEVDYWFKDAVASSLLTAFANGMHVYGSGIPQPKFAFSFTMDANEFAFIGKDHDTIKFNRGGVEFIMFKSPAIVRQLKNMVKGRITCVGKPQIDSYRHGVQVLIDVLEVAPPTVAVSALDLL